MPDSPMRWTCCQGSRQHAQARVCRSSLRAGTGRPARALGAAGTGWRLCLLLAAAGARRTGAGGAGAGFGGGLFVHGRSPGVARRRDVVDGCTVRTGASRRKRGATSGRPPSGNGRPEGPNGQAGTATWPALSPTATVLPPRRGPGRFGEPTRPLPDAFVPLVARGCRRAGQIRTVRSRQAALGALSHTGALDDFIR